MKKSIAFLLTATGSATQAGPGGHPAAGGSGAAPAVAATASAPQDRYVTTSFTLDSGTDVHQYTSSAGVVFAVAWSGPALPDLQELLGPHFTTLLAHGRQRIGKPPRLLVQAKGVVIVSGGRMGAFDGKAWVPALLPAEFSADDIR
jgi:hypothetical protein